MNKKGFTLVEVVTTIILITVLSLVVIPVVTKVIKDGKEESYRTQIKNIESALALWEKDNAILKENESVKLTLSQLKQYGYIDKNILNPKTKSILSNDTELIINKNKISNYEINVLGNNELEYKNINEIKLKGNPIEFLEINTDYNEKGTLENANVSGNVDNHKLGSNYIKYSNDTNSIYRTVIVRDTIGPTITFSNQLDMTYNQAINYDFKSGVITNDNSNLTPVLNIEHNIKPIPGKYTIKYTAIDNSGNETIKLREINIKE